MCRLLNTFFRWCFVGEQPKNHHRKKSPFFFLNHPQKLIERKLLWVSSALVPNSTLSFLKDSTFFEVRKAGIFTGWKVNELAGQDNLAHLFPDGFQEAWTLVKGKGPRKMTACLFRLAIGSVPAFLEVHLYWIWVFFWNMQEHAWTCCVSCMLSHFGASFLTRPWWRFLYIFLNLIWSDGLPAQLDRWVQPWNSRKSLTIAKTWCCSDSEGFGASSHEFLISGVYTRVLCEGDL